MGALEIGLVLPMGDSVDGTTVRWTAGFDQLEIILWPSTLDAVEATGPVLALLDRD